MQKIRFGNTEIEVPRLCVGMGTYGVGGLSSQARISPEVYGIILQKAFNFGLNFWDTSDDYGTHTHIREALKTIKREEVIIATKTHSAEDKETEERIADILKELNTNYIDILLMHEVDSLKEYHKRYNALAVMLKHKEKGIIRAVGVSTHSIDSLEFLVNLSELDVILTNFNVDGVHMDAGERDYTKALEVAYQKGKGVYVMKVLGEGATAHKLEESVKFALSKPFIHSVCVGINSMEEVDELIKIGSK